MTATEHLERVETDWKWADQFIPQIKRIVGPHLLVPSSLEVDRNQAADLVVLTARNLTIACRMRRPGYLPLYRNHFTMRSQRDNGTKTELAKIREGWGDWMFYGHASDDHGRIVLWWLLDLAAWREHMLADHLKPDGKHIVQGDINSHDGTHFRYFDATTFYSEPNLVIAKSHEF
jgi:hypothetical protein